MNVEYLTSSEEIRNCIHRIFDRPGKKWAIVAFVGRRAIDQLPKDVDDLNIICWPCPGATNPEGIRELMGAGIKVYLCEKLHSKVYWSEGAGVIIGSANLSWNALGGDSGQHECAVFVEDASFPIESLLSTIKYTEVTSEKLLEMDREYVAAPIRPPDSDDRGATTPTFLASRGVASPKAFKLAYWYWRRSPEETKAIRASLRTRFGDSHWANDHDVERGQFGVGDFVLQIRVKPDDDCIARRNCKWLRIDAILSERRRTIAIQLKPLSDGPPPPFEIDDQFRRYLKKVFNDSDWDQILVSEKDPTVKKEFIDRIAALYGKGN